jgi:hypothetical protein
MYLIAFCVFFIIAVPCFFAGCNLAVTSFCPAKLKEFHGHIYNKEVLQSKYECGNSKTGHYTCYQPYLYAIDDNNKTCEYFVNGLAFRYNSDAKDVLKKYKINQSMFLYKKHNSDRCIKKENIIASWYAGIIFFGLAAVALVCSQINCKRQYSAVPPPQRKNNIAFELHNFDFDDFVFDDD